MTEEMTIIRPARPLSYRPSFVQNPIASFSLLAKGNPEFSASKNDRAVILGLSIFTGLEMFPNT
jgi:hypothetical protein